MWLPIETAKWAFHKWKKCVGHSKWTRFSTDPYYFKTWGWCRLQYLIHPDIMMHAFKQFGVFQCQQAGWHCGTVSTAGAREIPRKSTWKEAARGAGNSAKNHGKLMIEWLKDWLFAVFHCACLKTRGRKHQWISYQNHWSVFGRSGWSLVLRHPSDIHYSKMLAAAT